MKGRPACFGFIRLAVVGLAVMAALSCGPNKKEPVPESAPAQGVMTFGYPSGRFPHYFLTYTFSRSQVKPFILKKVLVNGEEVRDFMITGTDDPARTPEGYQRRYALYGKKVTGAAEVTVTARCRWQPGEEYALRVEGTAEGEASAWLEARGRPAARYGWWDAGWKHCAAVILREYQGVARRQEPVHLKMALYSDRLTDPAREIRVVELDSAQAGRSENPYRQIASQVYSVKAWDEERLVKAPDKDAKTGEPIVRYLPTTTLEVAFMADVPARSENVYLVFYGNPAAARPDYPSDLVVSGPEIGQVVENSQMRIDLDDSSGAIFGVFLKQGKNVLLEHKLETNGAVHWNPDAYSPPHAWVHASDWKNPSFEQVSGPVFHMTRRWAPLPHLPSVWATVTYVFYAGKPYVLSSSLTEVKAELYGQALRNGEIVFNHAQLDEFAYKNLDGTIHEIPIATSLPHPEHVIDIPYNAPWVAFINNRTGIGFAAIGLEQASTNNRGGLSDAEQPYYYVANGPWIYFSRALNYSFGSNNASRMIHFAAGSLYYEKTAFLPFVLGSTAQDKYRMIADVEPGLRHSLQAMYYLDTDNRNNAAWVAPILTEPFDEGVQGALGQKTKH